ncbi:MAG: hypothetical protein LAO03_15960 [Acidobacteriia bacterium]|nr:hypothetical protein [Terriglobia bacterium]
MALPLSSCQTWNVLGQWACNTLRVQGVLLLVWQYGEKKGDVYNILWALVFGFATLNILGLVARRFEPSRNRLSFGEVLAITVVCVSVILLSWEMLYLFKILPIKLQPRY